MSRIGLKIFASALVGVSFLLFLNIYSIVAFRNLSTRNYEQMKISELTRRFGVIKSGLSEVTKKMMAEGANPGSFSGEYEYLETELENAKSELLLVGSDDNDVEKLNDSYRSLRNAVERIVALQKEKNTKIAEMNQSYESMNRLLGNTAAADPKTEKLVDRAKESFQELKVSGTPGDQVNFESSFAELKENLKDSTELSFNYQNYLSLKKEKQDIEYLQNYYVHFAENDITNFSLEAEEVLRAFNQNYQVFLSDNQDKLYISIAGLILVLVSSLALLFFTVQSVVTPVMELTEIAKKVSAGDLKQRLVVRSRDEVGYLASVFNDMVMVLDNFQRETQENEAKLQELNTKLEEKVARRTKELEDIKNNLEKNVEERTSELKQKLEELEKFRDLTVGRELKMIKLKQEIDNLRSKIDV